MSVFGELNLMDTKVQRKLTTILAADAAGYSSAMDADELSTLEALRAARDVFSKFITRHNGRIANMAGDGLIADFPSVVEAVQCAIEVQSELDDEIKQGGLRFRIGVHLGDVLVDGDDLLGEGVNLAARLQSMAEPGGVLVSQQVYDQVRSKLSVGFEYLGEKRPKNFSEDVPVYCVAFGDAENRTTFDQHAFGRNASKSAPTARPEAAPDHDTQPDDDLRHKVIRHAKILGSIWIGLLAINLLTGAGFWVQWPGLAMLAILALEASPLLVAGRFEKNTARVAITIAVLTLINLFSWSGTLWVIWPAGALIVVEVIRQINSKK